MRLISGATSTVLFFKQAVGTAWFHNSTNADPPFSVTTPLNNGDYISIEVIDSSDNRQIYRKRVDQLKEDCALPMPIDLTMVSKTRRSARELQAERADSVGAVSGPPRARCDAERPLERAGEGGPLVAHPTRPR